MGYPIHTIIEEYVGRIDNVTIPWLLRELEADGLIEIAPNTLGPCLVLSDSGMRMFSKHGDYLTYLLHLEKEKRKSDKPKRDLASAKKLGAITALLLTVLTGVGIVIGITNNRSIESLRRDQEATAKELLILKLSTKSPPKQATQLPDSTKVK